MSAYGLARRAGGALAEVPIDAAVVPAARPREAVLAERVGDAPVVDGGGAGGGTPAVPATPVAQTADDSKRELLLLIPGEAITAFLTVLGIGSLFAGTAKADGTADALFAAEPADGVLIGWAWAAVVAGLVVGLVFTVTGFRDAASAPSTRDKVLVTVLTSLAFLAIALQTPGNPLALQFGVPLAAGTAAAAVIAVVFIPIFRRLGILST